MIYYGHYETLGHTNRVFNIAKSLVFNGFEVKVLQAGKSQKYFNFGEISVIDIPFPFFDKSWFIDKPHVINRENMKERISFLIDFLNNFKPNIFMVEFFPFGRDSSKHDLIPLFRYIKKYYPNMKIVSIIGYPIISINSSKIIEYSKYFDKIFINSPKDYDYKFVLSTLDKSNKKNIKKEYELLFNSLINKIIFTNYIIDDLNFLPLKTEIGFKNNGPLIVVSRGGGVIYPNIISKSIIAASKLKNYNFFIVGGPSSTDNEKIIFKKLSNNLNNVIYKDYEPNLSKYIAIADLNICMSGYNTSLINIYYNKKCILIPKNDNLSSGAIEQVYRANMLNYFLTSKIMDYKNLSSKELINQISFLINKNTNLLKTDINYFNGNKKLVQELKLISLSDP